MLTTLLNEDRLSPPLREELDVATVHSLTGPVLPLRSVFYPLGIGVELLTNDPDVLTAAEQSWGQWHPRNTVPTVRLCVSVESGGGHECPPTPISRAQRHLLSAVADASNQMVCDLNSGFAFLSLSKAATRHPLYLRYYFLDGAALALISAHHATALHAACVSRNGRGFLLSGKSGAGKSTLAYACARAGWIYTSDDASYLFHDAHPPRVAGNPYKFRMRPPAKALFPELEGLEITPRAEGKPSIEVPASVLPGLLTANEAGIDALVFLHRGTTGSAKLISVASEAGLQRLHEDLYPVPEIRSRQIAALQQLNGIQVFELHYNGLDEAIEQLERLAHSDCGGPL